MPDQPIAHTPDGRPIYDNTPTVVAVILRHRKGLVAIRRANEPGKGRLGLPGGYHMRGESWREAGAREVFEETGYRIDPERLVLRSLETDEYGNNLVIAAHEGTFDEAPDPSVDGEAEEVLHLASPGNRDGWAFPRHFAAVVAELEG